MWRSKTLHNVYFVFYMHRVQLTGNSQQPQLKFLEEKIIHRKMHRLSLVFLSLKQPITFWNNTLFAFHFSKELHVTIVTSHIYNSCLREDSRGNSFIQRSCCEHLYDNRVDIDLCLWSKFYLAYEVFANSPRKRAQIVHHILKHLNYMPTWEH